MRVSAVAYCRFPDPLMLARWMVRLRPCDPGVSVIRKTVSTLPPGDRLRFYAELHACQKARRGEIAAEIAAA